MKLNYVMHDMQE